MKPIYLVITIISIIGLSLTINHVYASCATSDVPCNDLISNPPQYNTNHTQWQTFQIASFKGNHGTYPIPYNIANGTVVSTLLDLPAKALLFEINTTSNGQLTVELPRAIIDSKNGNEDVPYLASVYDIRSLGGPMRISPEEINNNEMRILKINFTKDITEIEIAGTFFVEKYHYAVPNSISSLSPLKQYETGLAAKDVTCKESLQLIVKAEDNSPACVKPDTASKLVERGWVREIVSTPVNTPSNMKPMIQNYTGYQSKIIPGPLVLSSCGGGRDGYHSFSNILNSTGFHVFYNITNSGTAFDDDYVIEPGHAGTITYVINAGSSPTPYMTNSYFQKELNITNYAVFYHYVTDYEELLHNPSVTIHNGDYESCFKRPNGSCAGLSGPITGPIQASVVDHLGVIVSFDPASELLQYNDTSKGKSSQIIAMTVSVDYDAPQGTYWIVLSPEECLGGKIFLLTIGNEQYHELKK